MSRNEKRPPAGSPRAHFEVWCLDILRLTLCQ
jgi:hypothetical protein